MRLLLDLGNTRVKWALQQGDGVWLARGAVAWADDPAATLAEAWLAQPAPTEVFGASVVDAAREADVAAQVRAVFSREPVWLRSPAEACGVRSAYAEPDRLGVDRFLAMLAAHAEGLSPCVLVGVGTALTLDALDAGGRHLGGLIAPGPQLMQQALHGATVRVHTPEPGVLRDVADNTADAVVSGCWGASVALVERFVHRMSPRLGGAPQLLLGGGDAAVLASALALPATVIDDTVLRGLAVWTGAGVAGAAGTLE